MPGCEAYASDAAVAQVVSDKAVRRMRQLRGLKPSRAADGRRMWCIVPGCHEPLPPPLPKAPRDEEQGDDVEQRSDSMCAACGQRVCMRCGGAGHDGPCTAPLPCGRQKRLYNAYAVGRIMACPRCRVHIERSGGCSTVSCARCSWSFTFKPFQTVAEVEETAILEDIPSPTRIRVTWRNLFLPVMNGLLVSFAGACVTGLFLTYLFESITKWTFDWMIVFVIPQTFIGFSFLFVGCFSVLSVCRDVLPLLGVHERGSGCNVFGTVVLSVILLVLQFVVQNFLHSSGVMLQLWQWLVCFFPILLCNVMLLALSLAHVLLIGITSVQEMRRRRGFGHVEQDDATHDGGDEVTEIAEP